MQRTSCVLIAVAIWLGVSSSALGAQAGAKTPPPPEPNPNGPLYRHKGEQYRVYSFPGTGESIPYRLFVPSRWTPETRLPLLVTLRAGNSVDNSYRDNNDFVKLGEERGYLVVTPLGYRGLSQPYYGSPYPVVRPKGPSTPAAGWTPEENERSEQDVMYVIDLVAKEYNVDPARIYLHGQNPSGSGALHLAAKYPDKFAALVVSSGPVPPKTYPWDRIRGKVALMVIHGDQDTSNPIEASQAMAAEAKAAGVETAYATVPGGVHLTAYLTYARQIFDFLDTHRK
jgi:poly(3-hydroxybutyrate) depolymerase